ncbi:MAG: SEC-C metal-binding domain-containing protein [Acidobacteriota bacterium]
MKIGRNAPCPCGSGKKYKACCLKLDRQNPGATGRTPVREAASQAKCWQADILPIPARFEDSPGARPAAIDNRQRATEGRIRMLLHEGVDLVIVDQEVPRSTWGWRRGGNAY